jgi:transposase
MAGAAETILKNWSGVVQYFHSRLTNAILESVNGRIQAARAKARGYRNKAYMSCILVTTQAQVGTRSLGVK